MQATALKARDILLSNVGRAVFISNTLCRPYGHMTSERAVATYKKWYPSSCYRQQFLQWILCGVLQAVLLYKHEAGNCDNQARCEHCYWITKRNYHGNIANSSVETRLLVGLTDGEGEGKGTVGSSRQVQSLRKQKIKSSFVNDIWTSEEYTPCTSITAIPGVKYLLFFHCIMSHCATYVVLLFILAIYIYIYTIAHKLI